MCGGPIFNQVRGSVPLLPSYHAHSHYALLIHHINARCYKLSVVTHSIHLSVFLQGRCKLVVKYLAHTLVLQLACAEVILKMYNTALTGGYNYSIDLAAVVTPGNHTLTQMCIHVLLRHAESDYINTTQLGTQCLRYVFIRTLVWL